MGKNPRPVALPKWPTSCRPSRRAKHKVDSKRNVYLRESKASAYNYAKAL